jgi:hypothetical protein
VQSRQRQRPLSGSGLFEQIEHSCFALVDAPVQPLGSWPELGLARQLVAHRDQHPDASAGRASTSNTRFIPAGEFIVGENWPIIGAVNSTYGWDVCFSGAILDVRLYTNVLSTQRLRCFSRGAACYQPADLTRPMASVMFACSRR